MRTVNRILVIQTAFIGDVILTLPLIQTVKDFFPSAEIDVVAVARGAEVCANHPAISKIFEYDKRGRDRGLSGFRRILTLLKESEYQIAFVPHRSLRSSLMALLTRIPIRIGFKRGGGRFLFTKTVPYDVDAHEIERNLSLLHGIGINEVGKVLPRVFPSAHDREVADDVLSSLPRDKKETIVAVSPGTIWNTKRWLKERFADLGAMLVDEGFGVVLVGGKDDVELCAEIRERAQRASIVSAAGNLSLLQSAALMERCRITVSNDSAPMHLSVAVGTPVVAIFGATVPSFGFSPFGPHDSVVETRGLSCRPCSIHGGAECPIKTFECMGRISPEKVFSRVLSVLDQIALRT